MNKVYKEEGFSEIEYSGERKKVLLIGDSISIGYRPFVKEYLADEFDVTYPNDNCRNTHYVLTSLRTWVNMFEDASTVALVGFNCGHWDIAHWNRDEESLTSEQEYAHNVKRIIHRLREFFPQAKIVFFTTTPANVGWSKTLINPRTNEEIERYNHIAADIAKQENVIVKDLYQLAKGFGENCFHDYVHFTDEYSQKLGKSVSEKILSILK